MANGKGTDDNIRIGIYVRESRDDRGENYETIETQRDLLIHFAEEKLRGKVTAIYQDDNVSGSGFEREGIRRLREDVRNGRLELLLLKDLSRLGRNNAQTLLFLDFLEEYGVRAITSDGRYDSTHDNDTVGIETWFNERYLRDVSRKIRSVMRFKIERGEYVGTAPFGYVKSKAGKNRLCIDEPKAEVVREIFESYLSGQSCVQIAKTLNNRGCAPPSQRADVRWSPAAVGRILSNRVYVGDTVQGISEKLSFKSKKTRRLPEDKWVITRDTHRGIIGREQFGKAAELRSRSSRNTVRSPHPFSGLIYCGGCGAPMIARKRKDRQMAYICSAYARLGRKGCASHYIPERDLIGLISEILKDLLSDEAAVYKAKELYLNSLEKSAAGASDMRSIENELREIKRQQDLLYKDRLENKISEELFLRTDRTIGNRISRLERKLNEGLPVRDEAEAERLLNHLRGNTESLCTDKRVLGILINKITVYDKRDRLDNESSSLPAKYDIPDEGLILARFN